ncbi:adenine phosphoribosyltransferase [Saccharomycopsis crataegensis]|uniref:adenine phosphoribosyltransferase n=1 Tax=Saccharomycopsis crataegensis TaxID=43959 RepID=A0AAV5QTD4_9ASCO|nr:adenine phosphoribosyltransferase [Saccharomycopsis crataegensis]
MSELASLSTYLKGCLKQYPNFPKEGILFEDFLPIFSNPEDFQKLIDAFVLHVKQQFPNQKIDYVVGLESRGFLFGPTLALALGAGFIPVRKPGKLPGKTHQVTFKKEYGEDTFEMQDSIIKSGSTVLIVDDILATGGSAQAAGELVLKNEGAKILEFLFVMELDFLKGRDKLQANTFTLLSGQTEKLQ